MAFHNSYFGDGVYPIVYSNLQCIGFEDRISDCVKDTYLQFSCSRDHTAGVLCGQGMNKIVDYLIVPLNSYVF